MPYITPERRFALSEEEPQTAGELNYLLTCLVKNYVTDHGLNYAIINDVVGALEGCKAEFQRRVVAPYEDKKIVENGDCY